MSMGHQITAKRHDDASSEADKMEVCGGIRGISGFSKTADTIEDKEYGSDNNWKEFTKTMKSIGEFTITVRSKKNTPEVAQSKKLADAFDSDDPEKLQLIFPAPISQSVTFDVLVTGEDITTESATLIDRVLKLQPTGEPVIVPVSQG